MADDLKVIDCQAQPFSLSLMVHILNILNAEGSVTIKNLRKESIDLLALGALLSRFADRALTLAGIQHFLQTNTLAPKAPVG